MSDATNENGRAPAAKDTGPRDRKPPALVRKFKPAVLAVSLLLLALGAYVLYVSLLARSEGDIDIGRIVAGVSAVLAALLLATRMFARECSQCCAEVVEGTLLFEPGCGDQLRTALDSGSAARLSESVEECGPVAEPAMRQPYAALDYELCPLCERVGRFALSTRVYQSRDRSRVRVRRHTAYRELAGSAVTEIVKGSTRRGSSGERDEGLGE